MYKTSTSIYHQFGPLPSCFLTESYSRLTNIKDQTTAQKGYLLNSINQ